ncbi:hypothetical protein OAN21_00620 [Alphaproteobacteria bacterium]|nr:hypothetical protein [Alphaproteobacteria bacterium]
MVSRLKTLSILFIALNSYGISYVPGTEDIPLMEGMTIESEPILFDKNQGEVLITKSSTHLLPKDVKNFYKKTLKNLGWTVISENKFKREMQILDMEIKERNGKTTVNFELKESL